MADSTRVLTALRNELVTLGLVRPTQAVGLLPPAHIEPRDGAPAPGDRADAADAAAQRETAGELVVTLRLSTELSEGPFDAAYRRRTIVDLVYRSSTTSGLKAGRALDDAIRTRLVGGATYGFGFILDNGGPAQTFILQAQVWGGLSPLGEEDGIRTDVAKYMLEVQTQ